MNPVDYLLTGFVAVMALGCWILLTLAAHAVDGFEDEFGFHFGIAPPLALLHPALVSSAFAPAEHAVAEIPVAPKRRRKAGSKPPMLPANLVVNDLNPRSPAKADSRSPAKAKPTDSGQTQIPLSLDQPPSP